MRASTGTMALLLGGLLLAPSAAADPVADLYAQAGRLVDAVDDGLGQMLGAAGGAAQSVAGQAGTLARPVLAAVGGVNPGAPGFHEWIATGAASGTIRWSPTSVGSCNNLQAQVEIRPAVSHEPNFVINLVGGEGSPLLSCSTGLRNAFPQSAWSGNPGQGWHARVENTPDALVIDVVIGPENSDGRRRLSVYWDASVNGIVGLSIFQGEVAEVAGF